MMVKAQSVRRDLFVRRCVFCGYDGALLRGGHAETCAGCGCDLRERPARSYAEMEGITEPPVTGDLRRWDSGAPRAASVGQRWLSFLFLIMTGLLLLIYLVAAAMP